MSLPRAGERWCGAEVERRRRSHANRNMIVCSRVRGRRMKWNGMERGCGRRSVGGEVGF